MKRAIATLVVLGFVFGSAAAVRAENKNNKDSGHHSSKNDRKDHCQDKDRCGHDHCGKDHCGHDNCGKGKCGSSMCGNDSWNTIHPIPAPKPAPTPIIHRFPTNTLKLYGSTTTANKRLLAEAGAKKFYGRPAAPSAPQQGQIPTLGTGFNGFAGAIGKDVGSSVGMGVTEGLKLVGGAVDDAGKAAGDVISDAGSALSDVGGFLSSAF